MKNSDIVKSRIIFFAKLSFSFLVLFLLFHKVPLKEVLNSLQQTNYFYFVSGSLLFVFCWLVNSYKWKLLLHHVDFEVDLLNLFSLNLVSIFYSSIVPGGQMAGELVKCYKIAKGTDEKPSLIFSVIMDRLTGLVAIVVIGFFGVIMSQSVFFQIESIKMIFFLLLLITVIAYLLYSSKFFLTIGSVISRRSTAVNSIFIKLFEAFIAYRNTPSLWFKVLLIGGLFQFLSTFSVYLVSLSLGIDVSLLDYLWINGLVSLVLIIPFSLMGLGLREVSMVYLLNLLGVDSVSALGLSLMLTFIYFLVGIIGGVIEVCDSFKRSKKTY